MDALMSGDFEKRFFDSLDKRFEAQDDRLDKQDDKLEKILAQTRKTNGRVLKHDEQISTLEKATGRKFNIPNNVLYLMALAAVIVLFIVASLMGINLKGII